MSSVPRRRTQEERKAESERKILDAATELFAQQGFVKTTLNQVGTEAGYTGGLVSSHFGSKANLLKAVLARISHNFLVVQVSRINDPRDTRGSLNRFVEAYLTDVARSKSSVRALYVVMGEALGAIAEVQEEVADFNALSRAKLAEILENGINTGQVPRHINPDTSALLVLAMIRGITQQFLADPRLKSIKDVIQDVVEMVDDYIWARPD